MAEDIKGLIEKIQKEGIQAAEEKATTIEDQARKHAQAIVEKAKAQANQLIEQAKEQVAKMESASRASLAQAARDVLITLRKDIYVILDKLMLVAIRQALSPQELAKIIHSLILEHKKADKGTIIISLNKEDLHNLEKGFLAELKEEIKKGVTLTPSEDIQAGFRISYDAGKSHFDFTDKALAEYLGQYLKPKLAEILKA